MWGVWAGMGLGRRCDALVWGRHWETGALSLLLIWRGRLDCSVPRSKVGMKLNGYSRISCGWNVFRRSGGDTFSRKPSRPVLALKYKAAQFVLVPAQGTWGSEPRFHIQVSFLASAW